MQGVQVDGDAEAEEEVAEVEAEEVRQEPQKPMMDTKIRVGFVGG